MTVSALSDFQQLSADLTSCFFYFELLLLL